MAMPRPEGKALKIAERVVPGLYRNKKLPSHDRKSKVAMSKVELIQTHSIENK